MGKLWDQLADSAETRGEYIHRDNRVSSKAITEASYALPLPHNRRNGVPEADVLKAALASLQARCPWVRRIEGSGVMQHTGEGSAVFRPSRMHGMADLMSIWCGKLLAIEVKTGGGRLSGSQLSELQTIQRCGGIGGVCCTKTSVDELLNDLAKGNPLRVFPPWGIPVY